MGIKKEKGSTGGFISGIIGFSIPTWINFVVSLLSAIVFTRVFSPDTYAVINIFSSSTETLKVILCLGLDSGFIRFYNEPPANDSRTQMTCKLLIVSMIVTLVSGTLVCAFWYEPVGMYFFNQPNRLYCILLFANALAALLIRFLSILYRMQFNKLQYGIQTVLFQSSRIFLLLSIFFNPSIETFLIILTATKLVFVVVYAIVQRKDIFPSHLNGNLKGYGELFKFSLFSAPSAFITKANTLVTQMIIKSTVSLDAVGIYSSAGYFATILSVLKSGFNTYWSAYMYANYDKEEEKERIYKVHDILMFVLIVLLFGMILFRDVIYLLIGEKYYESKHFFALILLFSILTTAAETTSYGIAIKKKNQIALANDAFSVLVNIGGCYILAPIFGLRGAAIAYAVSGLISFTVSTYFGQKLYKSVANIKRTIAGVAIMVALVIISTWVTAAVPMYVLLFAALGVAFFVYRKEVRDIIDFSLKTLKSLKKSA